MATQSIPLRSTPSQTIRPQLAGLWQAIQVADAVDLLRWARWSISAVLLMALTHALAPSAFGLALFVAIGVGLLRALRPAARSFWINAGLGLFGAILMGGLAGPAAWYFHEPLLGKVMPAAGLFVLLESLSAASVASLVRQRRLGDLAWGQLVATVAGFALALGLAVQGMGVWSIVYGCLLHSVALFAYVWSYAPASLRERPDFDGVLRAIQPERAGAFAARHADKVLVGGALGAAALGSYQVAWAMVAYPLFYLGNWVVDAVFPADRRHVDHPAQFRTGCLRAARALSWICLPLMLTLAVVAEPLAQTLLGPAWNASVTPLAAFAMMGAFQALLPLAAIIYSAKGRTDLLLGTPAASAFVGSVGAAIGLRWGIAGAAAGFAIGSTLAAIASLCVAFRLIELKGKDVAGAVWPSVNISLITELAAFLWLSTLDARLPNAPAAVHLLSTVGVALAVYFFLLRALRPAGAEDVEMMLARLPQPLRPAHSAGRRAEHHPIGELQLR